MVDEKAIREYYRLLLGNHLHSLFGCLPNNQTKRKLNNQHGSVHKGPIRSNLTRFDSARHKVQNQTQLEYSCNNESCKITLPLLQTDGEEGQRETLIQGFEIITFFLYIEDWANSLIFTFLATYLLYFIFEFAKQFSVMDQVYIFCGFVFFISFIVLSKKIIFFHFQSQRKLELYNS